MNLNKEIKLFDLLKRTIKIFYLPNNLLMSEPPPDSHPPAAFDYLSLSVLFIEACSYFGYSAGLSWWNPCKKLFNDLPSFDFYYGAGYSKSPARYGLSEMM